MPRCAERVGMAVRDRGQRLDVQARLDRRLRLGCWKLLRASGEAVAAVAAGLGAGLAEVADERVHLAAVVADEREDALDPVGLGAFPPREALEEPLDKLGVGIRAGEDRVAL